MNYEIRRETEFGCTIYSVYNTETNIRVNYFADKKKAHEFITRNTYARKNADCGLLG